MMRKNCTHGMFQKELSPEWIQLFLSVTFSCLPHDVHKFFDNSRAGGWGRRLWPRPEGRDYQYGAPDGAIAAGYGWRLCLCTEGSGDTNMLPLTGRVSENLVAAAICDLVVRLTHLQPWVTWKCKLEIELLPEFFIGFHNGYVFNIQRKSWNFLILFEQSGR